MNDEEDEGRTSKKEDDILYRTNLSNGNVFFMASVLRTCKRPTCPKTGIFFTNATRKASRKNVSHTSCRRSSLPLAKMAEKLVVRERLLNRLWVPYAPDEDIHAPYMAKYVKYF